MDKFNKITRSILLSGLMAFALVSCSSWGVPQGAKDALRRDFPDAQRIEWDKQDNGLFEAEFVNADVKTKVLYTPEGERELTEETLRFSQVPHLVRTQVRQLFPGQEIEDSYRRTDATGEVFYVIEVGDVERIFNPEGGYVGPFDALAPSVGTPSGEASSLPADTTTW